MGVPFLAKNIELVVKITKHCNLRCAYCYEFPFLGDKARMSLAQIEHLFRKFVIDISARDDERRRRLLIHLAWRRAVHGRDGILQSDRRNSGSGHRRQISIPQFRADESDDTADGYIEFLADKRFFQALGISFDVYGDDRRDILGRPSTEKVLKNLQRLIDNGVATGAICVLSRSTLPHIRSIFKFYERLGIALRILPFHIETVPGQSQAHGLRPNEIAQGLCEAFDLWLSSERPIKLYPLDIYLRNALHFMNGVRPWFYDPQTDESIFVVDVDGDVTGYETYLGDAPYGNLFLQNFEEILDLPSRKRHADAGRRRIERFCAKCQYFGACSGFPAASANALEVEWFIADVCYVAIVIGHIVDRLKQCGLGAPPKRIWPRLNRRLVLPDRVTPEGRSDATLSPPHRQPLQESR